MSAVADSLFLLQAQIDHKKRLSATLEELRNQETRLLNQTSLLKKSLMQEEKDVQRLKGHSLAAFFLQVTGKMDSALARERREAYAARVKFDSAMRELQAVQEDIQETLQDLGDLEDCEVRYQQKLAASREAVRQLPDGSGTSLLEKERELSYLRQQKQELEEAIAAGTTALRTMANIQQDLHSAKDWATHESKGPAFWADHARQEKLDEAQKNAELLQIQLQKFNRELSDVTIRPNLQPSIRQMLQFSDSFFTVLTSDLSDLDRIWKSCTLANQTRDHILGLLRQLQNALEEVRHSLIRKQQEMDQFILTQETLP